MKKQALITALEASSKSYKEDVPGAWSVNEGDDYVQLTWACESSEVSEDGDTPMNSDEPWKKWGGDKIIESASAMEPDDSGCDSYTDKYGDDMVCQWVQWNFRK